MPVYSMRHHMMRLYTLYVAHWAICLTCSQEIHMLPVCVTRSFMKTLKKHWQQTRAMLYS